MFIKICGITSKAQARAISDMGAHCLGFIFVRSSPRYICPERAREIVEALGPEVKSVGVFVNEPLSGVEAICSHVGLDLVQLHGSEPPEYCRRLKKRAIKALRLKDPKDVEAAKGYEDSVRALLLDSYSPEAHGGTGLTGDWSLARKVIEYTALPVLLAGGLDEGNVVQAIRQVRPFGVDASSRL
jgi:phosphoribosylanthranilate isomerase